MIPVPINILMTGAGAPGAAGIIRCLQQDEHIRLTVADARENAVGRYLNPDFIQIPAANDPSFIPALLRICRQNNIQIILPLVTKELLPLATAREEFEKAGVKVLVSSAAAIAVANNKARTYQVLQRQGLPLPQFGIAGNVEEFITAASSLGWPQKTFCFKPAESNGSRGFRIIAPAVDEFDLLFHHKPNNSFMRYEDALSVLSSKPFPRLLLSEYLTGDEFSVDCLACRGEAKLVLPRLRKKMINGITVEGEFVHDADIISYASAIIKALDLHGNIGIQVKKNTAGQALLLEVNPRVQGTIGAALGAGVNLPLLAIKQELGLPLAPTEMQVRWGTKFSRHWTEVFY